MTDTDRAVELLEQLVARLDEHEDLLNRLLTIVEGHVERIERLEYHVLHIQPLPKMLTARRDH